MIGDPPAPVNVRIVSPAGEVIPLELVYVGLEDDARLWATVRPVVVEADGAPWNLLVDELPPRTAILVELVDREGRPL